MTLHEALQILAAAAIVFGSFFCLLAGLGILRLPDLYTRMHAAAKAGLVGAGFILLAVALVGADAAVAMRAIMGILFLILTTPVSAHLLARAAFHAGVQPVAENSINEMVIETSEPKSN